MTFMPRRLQVEFSGVVQRHADVHGGEVSADAIWGLFAQTYLEASVPIRYRERTYGTTNIQRWKHGWLLLRMVAFAARKLKFV